MTIIYILGHLSLSLYLFILYLKLPEGQHKNNNNNNTGFPVLSSIIYHNSVSSVCLTLYIWKQHYKHSHQCEILMLQTFSRNVPDKFTFFFKQTNKMRSLPQRVHWQSFSCQLLRQCWQKSEMLPSSDHFCLEPCLPNDFI